MRKTGHTKPLFPPIPYRTCICHMPETGNVACEQPSPSDLCQYVQRRVGSLVQRWPEENMHLDGQGIASAVQDVSVVVQLMSQS
jgi:hypothetical protein